MSFHRRVLPALSATALLAGSMIGFSVVAASPALASTWTDLGATAWTPSTAGLDAGVIPETVAIEVAGAGGGSCGFKNGGTGSYIFGTLTPLAPTDQLTAITGTTGAQCSDDDTSGGAGGSGAYTGGNGSDGFIGFSPSGTSGGGGGGGSTAVYLNGSTQAHEVGVSGGGGGASPTAFKGGEISAFANGNDGGNGSDTGESGGPGDAISDATPGTAGLVGSDPQSNGLDAATNTCSGNVTCGGAGGNGGGSGGTGSAAATPGSATTGETIASGGSGAGGASMTSHFTSYIAPAGLQVLADSDGYATVSYANINAGSVNDVTVGAEYTGTTYTLENDDWEIATQWQLVGTAGVDYPTGLVIDPATGAISGSSAGAQPGTYNVKVRVTETIADPDDSGLGSLDMTTLKTVTMTVSPVVPGPTPTPDTQKPNPVRDLNVTTHGNMYKVSWQKPTDQTKRPVQKYILQVGPKGNSKLIINKSIPTSKHSMKVKRSVLLPYSVCTRGDVSPQLSKFRVRVLAINSHGTSRVSRAFITLKCRY